ncbi:tetratricopeptide repeat protein, partial [Candidatus Aerophobetes bacterium]|nr:tetratricopeptide repeat protein [Candidatus Aerophobetes bacterium]
KNLTLLLEEKGADLSAEKSKLDTLDHIIKDRPQFVWKKLKEWIDPVLYRKENKIPPENWWWYLDRIIEEEKRKTAKKWIKRTVTLVVAVGAIYFIFFHLIPKPDPYTALIQEAESLLEAGKINPALETYQKAIKIQPEKPQAYLMAGVICGFLGEEEKANYYFEKAKKRYPSLYEFYLQRGTSWLRMGNFSAAEEDAKKAIKINPESMEAHFLLGNAYEAQDKIAQAIAEFTIVSEKGTDPRLVVIARYKIGMLTLKQIATPPVEKP